MTQQTERIERFSRELDTGPPPSERSIKEIIDALRPQFQELVSKQAELARSELAPVGRQAGIAAGLLVVGAVFLLLFLVFFCLTAMYVMAAIGFPLWVAAGIVTVILLVIGGALAGLGAGRLRSLDPKPHRTLAVLWQNVD